MLYLPFLSTTITVAVHEFHGFKMRFWLWYGKIAIIQLQSENAVTQLQNLFDADVPLWNGHILNPWS